MKELGKVGVVGRFKPLHNGGAIMLETLCEKAEYVIIGIGSSNRYNARSPFTAEESKNMIDAVLSPNFSNYLILYIPDYGEGQKWKKHILTEYGRLDHFVAGNPYVQQLLGDNYNVIHPASIIPPEKHIMMRGTEVRVEMAKNGDWKSLVPWSVVEYLEKNKLVERFKKEFGLETLKLLAKSFDYKTQETLEEEIIHTLGE